MRPILISGLIACTSMTLAAAAQAECVKVGEAVSGLAGKLLYGKSSLEPGETFPESAQRGRPGYYYMRPAELMCIDNGAGEAPAKIDYLWIDVLRLDEAVKGNMQGWINMPATVAGVVSLETRRTGATAKIEATAVAQQ